MIDPIDCVSHGKEIRGPQRKPFHRVVAEMLVQPRPPGGIQCIPRLQHRLEPRPKAAAHQAKVAAVLARHQLEDRIRLAMALDAEDDSFIGPLHDSSPESLVFSTLVARGGVTRATRHSGARATASEPGMTENSHSLGNSSPIAR